MRVSIKISAAILLIVFALGAGSLVWMRNSIGANIWQLASVRSHLPDLHFHMTDDNGKIVTQNDFHGDVVLLFFGFTSCPDECPATLMRLTAVLKQLGKDANKIRVLFVSVDPTIDTPKVLHDYLKNFDPGHMTGLIGTNRQIDTMAKNYRAAYEPRSSESNDIVHSNAIYIFDANGHAERIATPSDSDEKVLNDLKQLMDVP